LAERAKVADFKQASEMYSVARDVSGLGASEVGEADIITASEGCVAFGSVTRFAAVDYGLRGRDLVLQGSG
jgi:hypothetical protein